MGLRLLVLDAYASAGREALREAGGSEAGRLYERMLRRLAPDAEVELAHPADADATLPDPQGFDGVAWTGSSLTIHHADDARVQRQVDYARGVYAAGVPSFGSCWAAQLAVVASGGCCAPSPRGREFGVARRIALTEQGRAHPLFAGKPAVFDAFTSHEDEVSQLSPGAQLLASNAWSRVQAVSVEHGRGDFWALQYHPEYDLHEVASLCRLRRDELVAQARFARERDAECYIDQLEGLHLDPSRDDLRQELDLGPSLLDFELRTLEVRNWLARLG